ncbi:flavodoxin [Clostridium beijerinckii]|uniref:Flavodoxin-like domain-containing protein n=1 Tax=Clostridium diolis TaxID=223919 RepID=A0AAV3W072_9CLOT|nr:MULTISPECIES: hypothetical protein [Clostridium]NOW82711.1 flavodoxin [Clostridium beijerinckii]GEA31640.1 hypothetical protein CDIOL_25630 [Clostridium diolis]
MKTVVIYKSKTGFTKKYAKWIAEELSADEKGMLAIYDKPIDFTDKKNIGKIIAYVNS